MIQLRDYQQFAVDEIRQGLAKYRKALFCAPCGAGKTFIFSYIAITSQRYNRKVLILSSRSEILKQNGGSLETLGAEVEYVTPKQRNIPEANITVAMTQTLRRRVLKEEWRNYLQEIDLLIVDECHEQIHDALIPFFKSDVWLLGCSATPWRHGHQNQLGEYYRCLIQSVTVQDLINLGYLAKPRHYSIIAPSLDGVKVDNGTGDYNKRQLAQRYEDRQVYSNVINEYIRLTPNKKAICFCVSSTQAIAMTEEFNNRGVSARYVLSGDFDSDETYSGERNEVFEAFDRNEFTVLVNVGICTAGFDQKDVEVVILNFATVSLTRYIQAVGRGSRITPTKKEFYILDAGRNFARFGTFEAERQYILWHDDHCSTGMMATKTCDPLKKDENGKLGCGCLQPITVKECKACGWIFPTEKFEYDCYLEEVHQNTENDIDKFIVSKRLEGWKTSRIMVAVCLANTDDVRKTFIRAYLLLNPNKTETDAKKYYYVWEKQVWSKIKHKKTLPSQNKSLPLFQ